ncbi:glycosyl hydrolase catalytic core-domain-containing protein [Mycena crocata]|nr:glycosyl hydrolase catalytic core-domain-containing protein [Mycena crocata]
MMSWKALQAFLVLTLLAGQSVASHNQLRHAHSKHALNRAPEKRLNRRASCKAPSSSLSASEATSTTKATTTVQHTTTTSTSKKSSSTSGSSGSSSGSSGSSGGGGNIKSVKAASGYTPNGIKAGTSSGNAFSTLQDHIGWWYDWTPQPQWKGSPIPVPMLWGGGTADNTDSSRLSQFKKISEAPQYMLGFEEPDCAAGGGSAGMSVSDGVQLWEQYIAPFKAKGTKLGSPSMCKQAAETWLASFAKQIDTDWDFTAIHVNKNNMAGVRKDIDHYAQYGKPIWVTEFACVDDENGFTPCTDQGEINDYINDIVDLFESDGRIAAYAYSNGYGLGNVWPMTTSSGALSASGKTYVAAISKYH